MITAVFALLHAEKDLGPNPMHTEKGRKQIHDAKSKLPEVPSVFIIGTGKRQMELLDLCTTVHNRNVMRIFSPAIGNADSKEGEYIILADGTLVPADKYQDIHPAAVMSVLAGAKDNTVLLTGRPAMMAILQVAQLTNPPKAESGKVYKIELDEFGKITAITCLN